MNLAELPMRTRARVTGFIAPTKDTETRLREIGFAEGDTVEVLHTGLFGRSPLNIRLHDCASIAMRPTEAAMILVEKLIHDITSGK